MMLVRSWRPWLTLGIALLATQCAVSFHDYPVGELDASAQGGTSTGGTGGSDASAGSGGTSGAGGIGGGNGGTDGAAPKCGDGVVNQPSEQCDDKNTKPCDGCEDCQRLRYLVLDGASGSYVSVPDSKSLELVGTPFTVEAWARVQTGDKVILFKRGQNNNSGWQFAVGPGGVGATVFGAFDHNAPQTIAAGWHHIAWTYDGSTSQLFLDGSLVSFAPHTAPVAASNQPLLIGGSWDSYGQPVGTFSGAVDEIRISNVVRYTGTFTPVRRFTPDANTAALWHCDEGSGGALKDASTNSNTGQVPAGVSWGVDDGYGGLFCGPCVNQTTYSVAPYACNSFSPASGTGSGGGEIYNICASVDANGTVTVKAHKYDGSTFQSRPYQVRGSLPSDPGCGPSTYNFAVASSNPTGIGTSTLTFTFTPPWSSATEQKAFCVTASTQPGDPGYTGSPQEGSWWYSEKAVATQSVTCK